LDQSGNHPDPGAAEADVPIHFLTERANHERRDERAKIDTHVEDRETGVPTLVVFVVQRADHGADVRFSRPVRSR